MASLFSSCFGCCSKPSKPVIRPTESSSVTVQGPPPVALPAKFVPPQINSAIPKEFVKVCNETPDMDKRKAFRYNCPICFRYLTHILGCETCKNYVCIYCADDLAEACKRVGKSARCPFCDHQPFVLTDVIATLDVKRYTDTPYSSAGSPFNKNFNAATKLAKAKTERAKEVTTRTIDNRFGTAPNPCTNPLEPLVLGKTCVIVGEKKFSKFKKNQEVDIESVGVPNTGSVVAPINSERAANVNLSAPYD